MDWRWSSCMTAIVTFFMVLLVAHHHHVTGQMLMSEQQLFGTATDDLNFALVPRQYPSPSLSSSMQMQMQTTVAPPPLSMQSQIPQRPLAAAPRVPPPTSGCGPMSARFSEVVDTSRTNMPCALQQQQQAHAPQPIRRAGSPRTATRAHKQPLHHTVSEADAMANEEALSELRP